MRSYFLALALLCASYSSTATVLTLTESNFESVIKSKDYTLVHFSDPNSTYCLTLRNEFDVADTKLPPDLTNVTLARVFCGSSEGLPLCKNYNIIVSPTIYGFASDLSYVKYDGGRRYLDIVDHLIDEAVHPVTFLKGRGEYDHFLTNKIVKEKAPITAKGFDPNATEEPDSEDVHGLIGAIDNRNKYGVKVIVNPGEENFDQKGHNGGDFDEKDEKYAKFVQKIELLGRTIRRDGISVAIDRTQTTPSEQYTVYRQYDQYKAVMEQGGDVMKFISDHGFPVFETIQEIAEMKAFTSSKLPLIWVFSDSSNDGSIDGISDLHRELVDDVLKPFVVGSVVDEKGQIVMKNEKDDEKNGEKGGKDERNEKNEKNLQEFFTCGHLPYKQWSFNGENLGVPVPTAAVPSIMISDPVTGLKYLWNGNEDQKMSKMNKDEKKSFLKTSFRSFLQNYLQNTLSPHFKSEPIPSAPLRSPFNRIQTIVGSNYKDVLDLVNKGKDVIVLYKVGWCSYNSRCARLKSDLEMLIRSEKEFNTNPNLLVVEIDILKNDVIDPPYNDLIGKKMNPFIPKENDSRSKGAISIDFTPGYYPTLYFFPKQSHQNDAKGEKMNHNPIFFEYQDDDGYNVLKKFIQSHQSIAKQKAHDEL